MLMQVVDTLAVVGLVRDVVGGALPWLSDENAANITKTVSAVIMSVPVLAGVFGWERLGIWLRKMAPMLNQAVGRHFERFSWAINPLLAMLFAGLLFGDSRIGLVAGAAWGVLNSGLKSMGKSTPAGLTKLKVTVVAAIIGGALLFAPQAHAESQFKGVSAFAIDKRLSIQGGVGLRRARDVVYDTRGYAVGQIGWALSDHLLIRGRLLRDFVEAPKWEYQGEIIVSL